MAANARIATQIHSHAETDIIAESQTDFKYPARNVLVLPVSAVWRTNSALGGFLHGDFGSEKVVTFVSLLGHNFDEAQTLTITIELSNNSDLSNPTYQQTFGLAQLVGITNDTSFPGVWNVWDIVAPKSRYWSIDITQPGNPDNYIEVGRIIFGEYWEPDVNFDYGYRLSVTDNSQISRTTNNVMRVIAKPKTRQVSATISHMEALEEIELNELAVGHEIFWSAYPESASPYDRLEQQHTLCGMLASQVPVGRQNARDRAVTIQLMDGSVIGTASSGAASAQNNTLWLRVRNNLSDVQDVNDACDNLGLFVRFPRMNYLDNSSFAIWQRGETFTGESGTGFAPDRWQIRHDVLSSETWSASRIENVDSGDPYIGAATVLRMSCSGASDEFGVQQTIVGESVFQLSEIKLTLSFWWYGGSQGVTLDNIVWRENFDGLGFTDYAFDPPTLSVPAGTWVRYEGTILTPNLTGTPDPEPKLMVRISALNPGLLTNMEFGIPKLEVGERSTRWEPVPNAEEWNRALHHYAVGEANSGQEAYFSGDINNNRQYSAQCTFQNTMYRVPNLILTHVSSSNFPASPGTTQVGDGGFLETRTSNGSGTGSFFRTAWTADTGF